MGHDRLPAASSDARDEDNLPTTALGARCSEEMRRFLRQEPSTERCCLILFRRALADHDDDAWAALHTCYARLVRRWAARIVDPGDIDEIVSESFARLYVAIDAAKFAQFADLRHLLQYVKLCVRGAALDRQRAIARHAVEMPLEVDSDDDYGADRGATRVILAADNVEGEAIAKEERRQFWEAVRCHLHNSQEEAVVRLSFIEGLPPREICVREVTGCATVYDVYRVKRTVIERLRRSPRMHILAESMGHPLLMREGSR